MLACKGLVKHLRLGEGQKLRRRHIPSRAAEALPSRSKVIRVDSEQEGSAGNKLQVIPSLPEEQAARGRLDVAATLPKAGAHKVLGLLLELLKGWRVASPPPLHQNLVTITIKDAISHPTSMATNSELKSTKRPTKQTNLGNDDLDTRILDIPPELSHAPASASQRIPIVGQIAEVRLIASSLVQPCRSPQQLILHIPLNKIRSKPLIIKKKQIFAIKFTAYPLNDW